MKLTPKAGLTARPEPQADKLAANVPQKPVRLRPAPITPMQIIVRNTLIYKPAPSEQTTTPVILDAITVVINVMAQAHLPPNQPVWQKTSAIPVPSKPKTVSPAGYKAVLQPARTATAPATRTLTLAELPALKAGRGHPPVPPADKPAVNVPPKPASLRQYNPALRQITTTP